MSDSGLRSQAPLVVVEAPAGCGKTHQCADYAPEMAAAGNVTRLLILTHTHAACSMFSNRTKAAGSPHRNPHHRQHHCPGRSRVPYGSRSSL